MGLGFCCGCRFISGLFVQSAEENLHKSAAQAEESSIAQDIPEVVKKPLMQVEFAGWIGDFYGYSRKEMMKEQGKLPSGYVKIAIENDHL